MFTIGIDVSKAALDTCLLTPCDRVVHGKFANSNEGFVKLLRWLLKVCGQTQNMHVCMESTGSYGFGIALFLLEKEVKVSVENPKRIKHFGIAIGAKNKTDRADAHVIARYCKALSPKPWRLANPVVRELMFCLRRREEAMQMGQMESNRLECKHLPKAVQSSIELSVKHYAAIARQMQARALELIRADAGLKKQFVAIKRICGVGNIVAATLLAELGGVEDYETAADYAAAAGLNPKLNESGTFKGKTTISKQGNAHVRGVALLPTLAAIQHNPKIKAFYERLLAAGKHKMAAVLACMRKLLMICYGVLKRIAAGSEPYDVTVPKPRKRAVEA